MTVLTKVRWVEDALREAYEVASDSPDPSESGMFFETLAQACNTFTKGVEVTPERLERPLKYSYIEHAERGAVFEAARLGVKCEGLVMVAPWAACTECARSIVNSGITTLVRHKQASDRSPARWIESIAQADALLIDGGVDILDYDGDLGATQIWHCEELWTP
jgi:deoxycytidylate deaminase